MFKKFLVFILILMSIELFSSEFPKNEHALVLGPAMGYGYSYKRHFNDHFACRVSGGFYLGELDYTYYNFGVKIDYTVHRIKDFEAYVTTGALLFKETKGERNTYSEDNFNEYDLRGVLGIGFTFQVTDVVVYVLEVSQVIEYTFNKSSYERDSHYMNAYPMVGVAIGFVL